MREGMFEPYFVCLNDAGALLHSRGGSGTAINTCSEIASSLGTLETLPTGTGEGGGAGDSTKPSLLCVIWALSTILSCVGVGMMAIGSECLAFLSWYFVGVRAPSLPIIMFSPVGWSDVYRYQVVLGKYTLPFMIIYELHNRSCNRYRYRIYVRTKVENQPFCRMVDHSAEWST